MSPGVLVYGYGNPGRLDDGLGPALAEAIGARGLPDVQADATYQLQVEDAARIADFDAVVFADADAGCAAPFELRELAPRAATAHTTHAVAPESVLALARELFGSRVAGYVLGIRGARFDAFGERLSPEGRANLEAAAAHLEALLREGGLSAAAARPEREEERA